MSSSIHISTEQGFQIVTLANQRIEVSVIPDLGAKLSSLRLKPVGREWLWHPPGSMRLFRCPSDNYGESSLVGVDECLPTIRACQAGERNLPGHGEVWNRAWTLDKKALETGRVRTGLRLPISPFTIVRTVSLESDKVVLTYELVNHSAKPEPFLWALHPLLTYLDGDRLVVPDGVEKVRLETATLPGAQAGQTWAWPSPVPELDLSELRLESDRAGAKVFFGPLNEGFAGIVNSTTGDRLQVSWEAGENAFCGLWLSRGAWSGYHHVAIEPTNAPYDSLAEALESSTSALWLQAHQTRSWKVVFHPS